MNLLPVEVTAELIAFNFSFNYAIDKVTNKQTMLNALGNRNIFL